MIIGTLLLGLWLLTMLYALRTLVGMQHRKLYPLIRYRQSDGTCVPLSIQALQTISQGGTR